MILTLQRLFWVNKYQLHAMFWRINVYKHQGADRINGMNVTAQQVVPHQVSTTDRIMVAAIENNRLQLAAFNHATHVKLAYCYLVELGLIQSQQQMTKTLQQFLAFNGVDKNKFHVTLTSAWLKAVWHFMQQSPVMGSSAEFLTNHPVLLNKDILLSHYSHERLFSDRARKQFIEPDLNPLP